MSRTGGGARGGGRKKSGEEKRELPRNRKQASSVNRIFPWERREKSVHDLGPKSTGDAEEGGSRKVFLGRKKDVMPAMARVNREKVGGWGGKVRQQKKKREGNRVHRGGRKN